MNVWLFSLWMNSCNSLVMTVDLYMTFTLYSQSLLDDNSHIIYAQRCTIESLYDWKKCSPTHFNVHFVELSLNCSEGYILNHYLTETNSHFLIFSGTTDQKGLNSATMGIVLFQAMFLRYYSAPRVSMSKRISWSITAAYLLEWLLVCTDIHLT